MAACHLAQNTTHPKKKLEEGGKKIYIESSVRRYNRSVTESNHIDAMKLSGKLQATILAFEVAFEQSKLLRNKYFRQ